MHVNDLVNLERAEPPGLEGGGHEMKSSQVNLRTPPRFLLTHPELSWFDS